MVVISSGHQDVFSCFGMKKSCIIYMAGLLKFATDKIATAAVDLAKNPELKELAKGAITHAAQAAQAAQPQTQQYQQLQPQPQQYQQPQPQPQYQPQYQPQPQPQPQQYQPQPQQQPQPQPQPLTSTHTGCSCTCPVINQAGGAEAVVNSLTVKELKQAARVMQIPDRSKLTTKNQLTGAILSYFS
jgi:outer membrane biosynthesis protein TonB